MGAITQEARITGMTLAKAFNQLRSDDREEHGTDPYSGSWHNSPGIEEVSAEEFNRMTRDGGPSKFEDAVALCVRKPIPNNMKVKTSVTNYPSKGTRKWTTKYEVIHPEDGRIIVSELKQADAILKARAIVELDNSLELTVEIVKVLESNARVAEINYKRSSTERCGIWDIMGTMAY